MNRIEFDQLASLPQFVGKEAVSAWRVVDQEMINRFASATGDLQWIHIDEARAKRESPFGATVAHGFLTLSLIPSLLQSSITPPHLRFALNYGLNKVRFPSPVPAGSALRGRFKLAAADPVEGGFQLVWQVVLDLQNQDKPACVAELVSRWLA